MAFDSGPTDSKQTSFRLVNYSGMLVEGWLAYRPTARPHQEAGATVQRWLE